MTLINLVTGGSGFIGSHLCKHLLNKREKVICIDNFSTGNKGNIKDLLKCKDFKLINHDITNIIKLNVNRVWHLACPGSPIHYQSNPIETAKTNFLGTYNMLELARNEGASFIYASTSEIYGDPNEFPQAEKYTGSVNPIGVRSCYEEGKRIGESLCSDFRRIYDLDIKIVRIFNTYGPKMQINDGRVISNFIVQALRNEKLTIYGTGKQIRTFCYIDDLIRGMDSLMESNYLYPVNLGQTNEIKIIDLAKLIKELINTQVEFTYLKLPEDDPKKRCPSVELAEKLFNWEPKINLREGLLKTIKYFQPLI